MADRQNLLPEEREGGIPGFLFPGVPRNIVGIFFGLLAATFTSVAFQYKIKPFAVLGIISTFFFGLNWRREGWEWIPGVILVFALHSLALCDAYYPIPACPLWRYM